MVTDTHHKTGLLENIRNLRSICRWDEWADSKLPFVALAWFILVLQRPGDWTDGIILLEVLSFTGFFLAFGYVFNDWMDRDSDQRAGKLKRIFLFRREQAYLLLGMLWLGSLLSLLRWLTSPTVAAILLACYFLALTYSGTPLRFKERGQWGLFVASLSQRTLPSLLIFAIMGRWDINTFIYLLLTLVIGLRWMITHQLDDLERDQTSQVKTYVAQKNAKFIKNYLTGLFILELVLLLLLGWTLSYPPLWWIYLVYVLLTIALSVVSACSPWQMLQTPSSAYLVLADFYFLYWPIGMALLYSIRHTFGIVMFLLLILLQMRYIRQHILDLKWLFSSLKQERQK